MNVRQPANREPQVALGLVPPTADQMDETPLGRPRDPAVEARALQAALEIYGRLGWSGFTFGKVAAQAHIGKSSLYLRWPTKADLLIAAFESTDVFLRSRGAKLSGEPFTTRIRFVIDHRLRSYFDYSGLAILRLFVEHQADPETMGDVWERSIGRDVLQTRQALRDGIASGDLREDTSVVHLGDALEGGMVMHALATPARLRERTIERLDHYIDELVERTVGPWLTEKGRAGCTYCRGGTDETAAPRSP